MSEMVKQGHWSMDHELHVLIKSWRSNAVRGAEENLKLLLERGCDGCKIRIPAGEPWL